MLQQSSDHRERGIEKRLILFDRSQETVGIPGVAGRIRREPGHIGQIDRVGHPNDVARIGSSSMNGDHGAGCVGSPRCPRADLLACMGSNRNHWLDPPRV